MNQESAAAAVPTEPAAAAAAEVGAHTGDAQ